MVTENSDDRIRLSVNRLREWQWLAALTEDPEDMYAQLRHEAKELIQLGTQCPARAKAIGKLVFAYHKLMQSLKTRTLSQNA